MLQVLEPGMQTTTIAVNGIITKLRKRQMMRASQLEHFLLVKMHRIQQEDEMPRTAKMMIGFF